MAIDQGSSQRAGGSIPRATGSMRVFSRLELSGGGKESWGIQGETDEASRGGVNTGLA